MKTSFRQFIAGLSATRSFRLRAAGLSAIAVLFSGCWTSIFTVAPTVEPVAPPKTVYTTTVTTPTPKTTTVTTITVTNYNSDMSFYLDLNAVAAAFAESRSVQEFEQILNSSRYMINNLDLNRDGWIDYLRVIETSRGYYHTLLIQACLAPGVFQDIATLIAERRADLLYVEVIGDRYLYGYNYIVRPVFMKRPPMWDVYGRPSYNPWSSPYHYGYLPSYYTKPKPIYLNHYQAYVNTYMTNHHYCHHCDYPTTVFYSGYTEMTKPNSHNDYATQHPNDSFEQRVTRTATTTGGVSVRNAGQLRQEVTRQQAKDTEAKKETTSSTSSTSTRTSSSATATGGSSARSGSTSTSTSSSSNTSASTSTSGTSSRSTSTTTSSNKTTSSTKTSTPTQTTTRQPSTTVESRVNKSGTTRTTVKTTDSTGRTETIKRESSSTRSTGTSTRSTSTSSSTSTRSSQGTSSESNPRSSQRGR